MRDLNYPCDVKLVSVGTGLKWILVAFLLLSLTSTVNGLGYLPKLEGAPQQQMQQRPNILFIVSEDNGPELSCYGAPAPTPILDALAKEGVLFDKAFVTQAGCSPSRASFLTGLYPHQNGQVGLSTWKYSMYNPSTPNLVNSLKNVGYRTGIIGKIHVNPESAFSFDFHQINGSNFKRTDLGRYAEYAEQFISAGDEPFYLQVNYPDAHDPFLPQVDGLPQTVLTGKDVGTLPYHGVTSNELKQLTADYYNSIMRLDALIGDLLNVLKASGKYDNTMVIYIGDHGADMLRGKRTMYEGGTRIPLIVAWPKHVEGGRVYKHLVSTIDLYPTFMAVSGSSIPAHLPGASLLNVLTGDDAPVREFLFTEYNVHSNHNPYPQRAVRNARYKLIHNLLRGQENPGYAFTNGRFLSADSAIAAATPAVRRAYHRMATPPKYELYDLESDPYEWNNLFGNPDYGAISNRLRVTLEEWQRETGDPMISVQVAQRFFDEVRATNEEKVAIHYSKYMDPLLTFSNENNK